MRVATTTILLASFIAVIMFSFVGMHAGAQDHNGGCVFASSQGIDCPRQFNFLDYISFHFNSLRNFSTVATSDSLLSLLLMSFLFAAAIGLGVPRGSLTPPKFLPAYHQYRSEFFRLPQKNELLRWLSLHENSPAVY